MLFPNCPIEAQPYGISLHLEAASLSKQSTSLNRFFSENTESIFDGAESWVINEVSNEDDDAQNLVLSNQKRLQESSASKSVTSADANKLSTTAVDTSNILLSDENISLSLELLDCIEQSQVKIDRFEVFSKIPNVNINFSISDYKPVDSVDDLISPFMLGDFTNVAENGDFSSNIQSGALAQSMGLKADNKGYFSILKESNSGQNNKPKVINTDKSNSGETLEKLLQNDINEMDILISASDVNLALTEVVASPSEMTHVIKCDSVAVTLPLVSDLIINRRVGVNDDKLSSEDSELELLLQGVDMISSTSRVTQKGFENTPVYWASTERLSIAEYDSLRPRMAMSFSFELDDFQKQSVMRLERRECVFVSAHTSAGKTVIAEYAIALANK